MTDEFSNVTDSMRAVAMRLYDRELQDRGQWDPLKVLAIWMRLDYRHRLAIEELEQFLGMVSDDPVVLLNRMVCRLAPAPTLH
jgi:hypothetical protein